VAKVHGREAKQREETDEALAAKYKVDSSDGWSAEATNGTRDSRKSVSSRTCFILSMAGYNHDQATSALKIYAAIFETRKQATVVD